MSTSTAARRALAFAGVLAFIAIGYSTTQVSANHEPANKVSASGSSTEVVSPQGEKILLSDYVHTNNNTDLILGVTAECAITTELATSGNDTADAHGSVVVWIEIDGVQVPVAEGTDGKVTFCNRAEQRKTSLFEDQDATIETFQMTRNANGFNWMALDIGIGTHLIEVKATLEHGATPDSSALAAVGKRTLIIEPTKAANDEKVTEIG